MSNALIRGVTLDVSDRARAERFWSGLLDRPVTSRLDEYSYFNDVLPGLRFILQVVDDPKVTKNRMHLDLIAEDPDALLVIVEELGGSIIGDVETADYHLTVAADPDGNEFCVNRRLSGPLRD